MLIFKSIFVGNQDIRLEKYRLHKERHKFRNDGAITQKVWIITRKDFHTPSECRPGRLTAPNARDKGERHRHSGNIQAKSRHV